MAESDLAVKNIKFVVRGMDCGECCATVRTAILQQPGVMSADVYLAAERAVVVYDPAQSNEQEIYRAVEQAGYTVELPAAEVAVAQADDGDEEHAAAGALYTRSVLAFLAFVFGGVLLVVVAGEWFGLIEVLTAQVPFWVGALIVLAGWYPVLRNVIRATWRGQVIAHTLMSVGVVAALVIGEWVTAAIVVLFMRVGDSVERFTTERARRAVKDLAALAPKTARLLRNGVEIETPIAQVAVGDVVVVRPGEQIPVDGTVVEGRATVNQATITGESMPVEVEPGAHVYAASIASLGSLRVRVTAVGADSTFGKVIRLVEEAEAHRADVQRIADRFSGYFLPMVATIALLTFILRRDPLATAAVLVVACSCSLALATPIAVLASIGASAKRGLVIKGGKYLEALAKVDVLLIDKTGTLTVGQPEITDIVRLDGRDETEILSLAAAAERDSEHPLAAAVLQAAQAKGAPALTPAKFEALPGQGVRAWIDNRIIEVGNDRMVADAMAAEVGHSAEDVKVLSKSGKTVIHVVEDGRTIGLLGAADKIRPEVPEAIAALRREGVETIELLTGDNHQVAATLAAQLEIDFRAELLPEDKLAVVRAYQAQGRTVAMVGDGVNDAPALAQADIGIAMGASGTDIAMEAAHILLMRDDWRLVPDVVRIARRTMRVVKMNFGFTAVYNLLGLSLAAFGLLPPIYAAMAQSLPDLGILANSSRLLRQK